jgi:hypothetical protein
VWCISAQTLNTGNLAVSWDVVKSSTQEYTVVVRLRNNQLINPIPAPGWSLSWTWMMSEMVESVDGAQVLNLAGEGPCKTLTSNSGDRVIRGMVLSLSTESGTFAFCWSTAAHKEVSKELRGWRLVKTSASREALQLGIELLCSRVQDSGRS